MQSNFSSERFLEWRALGYDTIAPRLSPQVASALTKVLDSRNGDSLSHQECLLLAECKSDDLLGLLVAADHLRSTLAGEVITYVVTRNINFTNICFVGCKFCAFSRSANHPEANFLSLKEIAHKAREAAGWGATEVCIQGGLPRRLPRFHYRDILQAVREAVPGIHIHAFSPMEIIYGVEMDLEKVRYGTFEELRVYCYHVASAVGLVSIEIFGYRNPACRAYAIELGLALQTTNIIRDVGKDLSNGRIYLPQEDLTRFDYSEEDLLARKYNEAFVRLMEFEAARAEEFFAQASALLPREDRRSMVAAEIMASIYHALLKRMRSDEFRVFEKDYRLSKLSKAGRIAAQLIKFS